MFFHVSPLPADTCFEVTKGSMKRRGHRYEVLIIMIIIIMIIMIIIIIISYYEFNDALSACRLQFNPKTIFSVYCTA